MSDTVLPERKKWEARNIFYESENFSDIAAMTVSWAQNMLDRARGSPTAKKEINVIQDVLKKDVGGEDGLARELAERMINVSRMVRKTGVPSTGQILWLPTMKRILRLGVTITLV